MTTLAFFLVIISAFIHASWNFVTKKVSEHLSVYWIGLLIASIASIIASFLLPFDKKFEIEGLIYFILTGIIHLFYFLFLIQAYRSNDFSSAYPVARGVGVLGASIFGILLFKESISFYKIFGICFILSGILAIGLKKGMSFTRNLKDLSYAVLVGLMIICYTLVDKKGVHHISPVIYSIGVFVLPALFFSPYALLKHRSNVVKCLKEYKIASFLIGLGSFATYLIILYVYQFSDVSYVVPVRETSVAIGALYGFLLLKEKFSCRKVLAILAITIGLILIKMS